MATRIQSAEQSLIDLARRGDAKAMDALLTQHEKSIYRFGLRMCGSEDAAKDVLQQTLLTAFKTLRDFRGDAQLSTWLYQIARSFCGKTRRKKVDEPDGLDSLDSHEAQQVASSTANPEDLAQARQIGEVLELAIMALPPNHREALILRDVEGLTAEEAATVQGIPVANLKTRLHRARAELRQNLSALLEPGGTSIECKALSAELADFAAEDIEKATCAQIEAHLARCKNCEAACESLKRTVSLCKRIPGDEVPAPIRAAVRQALEASLPQTNR
ncbi:MAG: sigma-70 family RNA polymerase sigma factor [Myxococcota bacterium]|nr:sigma-70 family RNA polymerase sigma factor [Myxococcota bacterium]